MTKPNPLSYGLLAIALVASALYAAVQYSLQQVTGSATVTATESSSNQSQPVSKQTTAESQVVAPPDTEQTDSDKSEPNITKRDTQQDSNQAEDLEISDQADKPQSVDKFIPTESISEDLAVSFPVDI